MTPETSAADLASRLGISVEAVELTRAHELIDLHLDTFIPHRLWGYDWFTRHRNGPIGRHFFGHVDWPRMCDGGLTGGMWSITTNPFRTAAGRWAIFQDNLRRVRALIEESEGRMSLVRTYTEYREARARGEHAAILAIQGGAASSAFPP